jgi:hypothetical protein
MITRSFETLLCDMGIWRIRLGACYADMRLHA